MSKANSQELNRAIQAYQRGDLSGAAATCRAYLDAKPSAAGAWHLLGLISFQEKDFEHAERYLMRAVNLKPDAWSFHLNLGAVRAAAGRPHQALLAYRAAATLKPRSPDAHYNLGNALLDLGREADAEVAYKTAVDLSPDDADLWAKLATAQSRIHKAEAACRSAREALDLKPEHTTARETLARALVERCEAEAAESELRRLQKDPAHGPESTDLLGRIVLTRGNFSEGWRLRAEAFEDLVTAAGLNTLWDGGSAPESIWIEGSSEIAENVTLAQLIPHSPLADAHVHLRCPEACHAAINHLVPGLKLHGEDSELATDIPLTALTSLPALMKLDESASAALLTPAADDEARKGESIGICLDTAGNSSLMARDLAPLIQLKDIRFDALHPLADPTPTALSLTSADTNMSLVERIQSQPLIIGGDGVTARLAAAMGKPVWLLCDRFPDWAWGLDLEQSSLYPNVRLFRQARCGDWHLPVASLVAALRQLPTQP